MLPDVEGIEVGRRLRERGFKTAVLFLTAKDATENEVEALREEWERRGLLQRLRRSSRSVD